MISFLHYSKRIIFEPEDNMQEFLMFCLLPLVLRAR
jgi:hypothetical protein